MANGLKLFTPVIYKHSLITVVERFITLGSGVNDLKLSFFVTDIEAK